MRGNKSSIVCEETNQNDFQNKVLSSHNHTFMTGFEVYHDASGILVVD